jgi:hypothetical protein
MCTTLCDKVCQWLATGRWFSPDSPVSSTNKTDNHDITEILLKVALNTNKQTNKQTNNRCGNLCYRPRYQYTVRPGCLLIFMYTNEIEIIKLNDLAFQSFDF